MKNRITQILRVKGVSADYLKRSAEISDWNFRSIVRGGQATSDEWARIAVALKCEPSDLLPNQKQLWDEIDRLILLRRRTIQVMEQHRNTMQTMNRMVSDEIEEKETTLKELDKEKSDLTEAMERLDRIRRAAQREETSLKEEIFVREINIPREYGTAAVTILQGFIQLLRNNFSDQPFDATIRQDGMRLTLVVTGLNGRSQTITELLNAYGDVVLGRSSVQTITNDPALSAVLQSQIEISRSQIELQREVSQLLNRSSVQLEKRERWMQEQISFAFSSIANDLVLAIDALGANSQLAMMLHQVKTTLESSKPVEEKRSVLKKALEKIAVDGVAAGVSETIKSILEKLVEQVNL